MLARRRWWGLRKVQVECDCEIQFREGARYQEEVRRVGLRTSKRFEGKVCACYNFIICHGS